MNKTLGSRMIEYRARNSLSQAQLAQRVGVSVMTINMVERGLQTPSRLTREKIELIIRKKGE